MNKTKCDTSSTILCLLTKPMSRSSTMTRTHTDGDSRMETLDTSSQDTIYKIMKMSTWHYTVQQSSLVS